MIKVNRTFVNCIIFWAENGADCISVLWGSLLQMQAPQGRLYRLHGADLMVVSVLTLI